MLQYYSWARIENPTSGSYSMRHIKMSFHCQHVPTQNELISWSNVRTNTPMLILGLVKKSVIEAKKPTCVCTKNYVFSSFSCPRHCATTTLRFRYYSQVYHGHQRFTHGELELHLASIIRNKLPRPVDSLHWEVGYDSDTTRGTDLCFLLMAAGADIMVTP